MSDPWQASGWSLLAAVSKSIQIFHSVVFKTMSFDITNKKKHGLNDPLKVSKGTAAVTGEILRC